MTRPAVRHLLASLVALAMAAAPAAWAQEAPAPPRPDSGIEAQAPEVAPEPVDAARMASLNAAIADDPRDPALLTARATQYALSGRPDLAQADLDAALAADPTFFSALVSRAALYEAGLSLAQARADLDAALAVAPDNLDALAASARVNARMGRVEAARADYDRALALAPEDAGLTAARDRLDAAAATRVTFSPEAVMALDFQVAFGSEDASHLLYFVHGAPDLAEDYTGVDRAALDRAVAAGALRVVHLFTFTGADASVWGNLAMICAGREGFAATHAALAAEAGIAALDTAARGDVAPLTRLLAQAYAGAGLPEELVEGCALNRPLAARYLADWQARRRSVDWQGVNLMDHWPVWVLDGVSLAPAALSAQLVEIAPAVDPADTGQAPDPLATDTEDGDTGAETAPEPDATAISAMPATADAEPDAPVAAAETPGPGDDDAPAQADLPGRALIPAPERGGTLPVSSDVIAPPPAPPAAETADAAPTAAPDDAAPVVAQDGPAKATPPALFPPRPAPAEGLRMPVELRGIYAPTLAECLTYLGRVDAPDRAGAVLPAQNGADGPGTILVTSRRVYLFDPDDTECALVSSGPEDAGGTFDFVCGGGAGAAGAATLTLSRDAPDGLAPRLSAALDGAVPVSLRQCHPFGQLGNAVAPLWRRDGDACAVSVPTLGARATFSPGADGTLQLHLAPDGGASDERLFAAIDGAPLGDTGGSWDGDGWTLSLGPFERAAEQLGWGMFLDLRSPTSGFADRLPLFGSSAAMEVLAGCASGG